MPEPTCRTCYAQTLSEGERTRLFAAGPSATTLRVDDPTRRLDAPSLPKGAPRYVTRAQLDTLLEPQPRNADAPYPREPHLRPARSRRLALHRPPGARLVLLRRPRRCLVQRPAGVDPPSPRLS